MKKRRNLLIFCLIIILIVISGIQFNKKYNPNIDTDSYLSSKDEKRTVNYCNSNDNKLDKNSKKIEFEDFNGKWSLMEFKSDKDNKIIITDNTKISEGKFYVVILDLEGNIIAKKNELTETGDIIFTTPKDGKYFIRIVGDNASGKFDVSVNASNNINVSRMDFFDKDFFSKN
jgi:hypothetical protein